MKNSKRVGRRTIAFLEPPAILAMGTVAGIKEGEGPLRDSFDEVLQDDLLGQNTWEQAESRMHRRAVDLALEKAGVKPEDIDMAFGGDLLNQCIGTSFALRDVAVPMLGLYGACSTMAEGLLLAAMCVEGGYAGRVIAQTGSHFCSAERQYRLPLDYGGQRAPSSQWTVTGTAAAVIAAGTAGTGPYITHATVGEIIDAGVTDVSHMGAAMAPSAYDTLSRFFRDTGMKPEEHDLIVTGDLGHVGRRIVSDLFQSDGITLGERYNDCGVMIFDSDQTGVHAGGSGCGCSAVVLGGHILNGMRDGRWKHVLFCGTGALLSPISVAQGASIPGICHLVRLSME